MSVVTTNKRIDIIDALRGFALAGIVIVHMVENYIGGPATQSFIEGTNPGIIDQIVKQGISFFLSGKFFALFSFLFGLSFFIQMRNAAQKGANFGGRFLWRIILLMGIGFVHHAFYKGDILTIYAALGIFLIPFYKIHNRWLLVITGVLFLGIGRYIVFAITGGEGIFGAFGFQPDSPDVIAYYETIKNGSFTEVVIANSTDGHLTKMDFQLGVFSRAYLTFGFFLLGLYAGRTGFFQNYKENKKLVRKLLIGSLITLVVSIGIVIGFFASAGPNVSFDNWMVMFGLTGVDLFNFCLTIIIIVLFVMAYRSTKGAQRLKVFAPYGRMALTNYFMQSIIGTFIFFGWGLGYLGQIPNRYTFLIAIGILILQIWWSKWWLSRFNYGPLEWLWRSLTYFKWFPFKKK